MDLRRLQLKQWLKLQLLLTTFCKGTLRPWEYKTFAISQPSQDVHHSLSVVTAVIVRVMIDYGPERKVEQKEIDMFGHAAGCVF